MTLVREKQYGGNTALVVNRERTREEGKSYRKGDGRINDRLV